MLYAGCMLCVGDKVSRVSSPRDSTEKGFSLMRW